MKLLFYLLAALAGLFGLLSLGRVCEQLFSGGGFQASQFAVGFIGIVLAVIWTIRARSSR